MQKDKPAAKSVLLFLIFLASACMKDNITKTYQISTPIYEVLSRFRESIHSVPPTSVQNIGRISFDGKYIFLSEPSKGIHIIDNSHPTNPRNISFITIPGNNDLAIKGNTLYADAYSDLVAFDISDPEHVVVKTFLPKVFPDAFYMYEYGPNSSGATINPDSINIIVGWSTRDTTVNYNPGGQYYGGCFSCPALASAAYAAATGGGDGSVGSVSTNGSTARFSIINNFLYTVGTSNLTSIDIKQPYSPSLTSSITVNWRVETIFPMKDNLFIGTNSGVYMYNVLQNPSTPSLIGQFIHLRGCDPVIADDNYAYVTVNDSSACGGIVNQLQIVDIKNLSNPFLFSSYQFTHPGGLSKDGNSLFVCDGKNGLKIYDASDAGNLKLIKQFRSSVMFDVIAENGLAIVIAKDGLYQYDYSDIKNIHLISKL